MLSRAKFGVACKLSVGGGGWSYCMTSTIGQNVNLVVSHFNSSWRLVVRRFNSSSHLLILLYRLSAPQFVMLRVISSCHLLSRHLVVSPLNWSSRNVIS